MQGRVDFTRGARSQTSYDIASSTSSASPGADYCAEVLRGMECSVLAKSFFSVSNVEGLHQAMRYEVYRASRGKHVIDRQSNTELLLVMRATYLMNGTNTDKGVREEVAKLNAMVLEYAVPKILQEIEMYLDYKRNAGTMPIPMPRSQIATMKGTRTLEMREF